MAKQVIREPVAVIHEPVGIIPQCVLATMLDDHRIPSWVRTEYRNMLGAYNPDPPPEISTDPAEAEK